MSQNLAFRQTAIVRRSADEVFAYITDLDHAALWRADLVESSVTVPGTGEARTGGVVREVGLVLGRRIVTESLVGVFRRPRRLTLNHLVGPLAISREFTCVQWPAGTEVTYTVTVETDGNWTMLAPYLRRLTRRTMAQSLAALGQALNEPFDAPYPVERVAA